MSSICIIPARGGSKRIPRKNIKDFLGKPIIAYSIEVALQSKLFDEVMVSTDDDEIAQIALAYGAKIPFKRSVENSSDFATTAEVLIETILKYQEQNIFFEYLCCIYPTAPFITVAHLIKSQELLKNQGFNSVFPVCAYSYPISRSLHLENNKVQMIWPENKSKRSQDLPNAYHDAGLFYFLKTGEFLREREIYTANSGAIVLPNEEVQDIDNESDWEIAKMKYKFLNNLNYDI